MELGWFGSFVNLPLGPLLMKGGLGAQFSSSSAHPGPAEEATHCDHL